MAPVALQSVVAGRVTGWVPTLPGPKYHNDASSIWSAFGRRPLRGGRGHKKRDLMDVRGSGSPGYGFARCPTLVRESHSRKGNSYVIWNVWRVLRILTVLAWYHHVMIGITVLVPLLWAVIVTLWLPDGLVVQVMVHLGFFVLAELSVAFALKRDRSTAERFVSLEIAFVKGAICTLREQHAVAIEQQADLIGALRRQIEAQDEVFKSALESLGATLPGRRFSVSAGPIRWGFRLSEPTVTVTRGGSKWVRFRRLFPRFGHWLKETVLGKPDPQ